MSHIPEEIVSSLRSFSKVDSPALSKPRRLSVDPRKRNRQMEAEKRKAVHARRKSEMSRPKIVVTDPSVSPTKTAAFYLQQAREKYLARNCSANEPKKPRTKSAYQERSYQTFSGTIELSKFDYPTWLKNRPEFYNQKTNKIIDYSMIVKTSFQHRSTEEKELLFKWVSEIHFFESLSKQIVSESCDKFTFSQFKIGETLPDKSTFIIYSGKIGVFSKDSRIVSVGPKGLIREFGSSTSYSYVAEEDVEAFELTWNNYESILLNIKKSEKQENTEFLLNIRYFQVWSFLRVQHLSNALKCKMFRKDEVIYEFGEESEAFYILKSGKVSIQVYADVSQSNKWPVGHKEWKVREVDRKYIVKLASLNPGKYFGEIDLIEESQRQTRAVAIEPCECLVLNKKLFFEIFTMKDTDRFLELRSLVVPSNQELKKKIIKQINERSSQDKALLDAMKVDLGNINGRDLVLDSRSRRLNNWVCGLKERRKNISKELRKNIVKEDKKYLTVARI